MNVANNLPLTMVSTLPRLSGHVLVGDARIFYRVFGTGHPLVLLHGGLASSEYWHGVVPVLSARYSVVLIDTRGHGRSTLGTQTLSYALLARDTIAVMDHLQYERAGLIGWSDGAIVAIELGLHNAERVECAFAFAANYDSTGIKSNFAQSPLFAAYLERCRTDHAKLSGASDGYDNLLSAITQLWTVESQYSLHQLCGIHVPFAIAHAQYDEAIKEEHARRLAAAIPGAEFVTLSGVSHFALVQDPNQVATACSRFVQRWLQ